MTPLLHPYAEVVQVMKLVTICNDNMAQVSQGQHVHRAGP